MDWTILIDKVENGFVVSHYEAEGDVMVKKSEIIEEVDAEGELTVEQQTMTRLLYAVTEYFGMPYNKFAKNNLNISWDKKGHKVE